MKVQRSNRRRPIRLLDFNDIQLGQLERWVEKTEKLREEYKVARRYNREASAKETCWPGLHFWDYVQTHVTEQLTRAGVLMRGMSEGQLKRLVKALKKRQETENFLWLIEWYGSGYQGRKFFIGTENAAEQIRKDKCNWEWCLGRKYKLRAPFRGELEGEQE